MNQKKCDKCTKKMFWEDYTQKKYCEKHFLEAMEKRIRKNLRINKQINIKKNYYIEEDTERKHLITKYFLQKIFQNRLKLTKNTPNIITNKTLDDETKELLNFFMKKQKMTQTTNIINVISDEEAIKIAQLLNLEIKIKPQNHQNLTKKDPQIIFATQKSKKFIEKRTKK